MTDKDPPARIPRLRKDEWSDATREIFALFAGPGRLNVDDNHVLNTFALHPELAQSFLQFNRYLLMSSTLPVRLRQIAIMRALWLKKARYLWSSHLRTSLRNGLSGEEFEPIKAGAESPYWRDDERAIVRATDQVVATANLDEDNWRALGTFLDRQQTLDFLFTVGTYVLLAMVCNTLRIDREEALLELAERYGAPE